MKHWRTKEGKEKRIYVEAKPTMFWSCRAKRSDFALRNNMIIGMVAVITYKDGNSPVKGLDHK